MANQNTPKGLVPYGQLYRATAYVAGSTCYPNDPVALASDGQVDPSVTVPLLGVALNYATVGQTVMVADHPDQLFEVESDEATATTDVGLNASLALGIPSTTYKMSRCYLDGSTAATTNPTYATKILGIAPTVGNSAAVDNVNVIVKINNHLLGSSTGTDGL